MSEIHVFSFNLTLSTLLQIIYISVHKCTGSMTIQLKNSMTLKQYLTTDFQDNLAMETKNPKNLCINPTFFLYILHEDPYSLIQFKKIYIFLSNLLI